MDFEIFEKILKQIGITKKEFANFLEINHTTITKWKMNKKIPKYAEIILNYLIEIKQKCDKLKEIKEKS
jgi:DNA-binding transcriptional regulator YiaG